MKVSVVMPAYNCANYVKEAIDSILAQELADFELIVIDDASTDNTGQILQSYADHRLRIITQPANCGHGIGQNIGLACAKGEYIAIMDADDIAMPERLREQVHFLDHHPEIHILGARGVRVNETIDWVINVFPHPRDDSIIKARLILMNGTAMLHPTTVIRAGFIENSQLWYAPRRMSVDTAFWIKCIAKGACFHALDEPLIYKRRHRDNVTVQHKKSWEPEKIPLRVELLGMFYPDLSFRQANAIAILMEEGRGLTADEMRLGASAIDAATAETLSYFGEDKHYLNNLLREYARKATTLLAARPTRTPLIPNA
jgi:glycosyltransferase involved in cell wall biosynthesis